MLFRSETRTLRDNERKRARSLLATQFSALGDALSTRTLRVDGVEAASTVTGALGRVSKIDEGTHSSSDSAWLDSNSH